ncbi:MAG TPA: universal stress protein [Miltoncostaeaceae bacterium]|jgi:nucleotide-binding universal stress UspA family protein|nr:universal stress protein [Miltoncostaeaceae bacterium]
MSILVGYDRSDASVRALERAAAEAREAHARLVVLAVLEMPLDPRDPRQFGTAGDGTPITGGFTAPPEITETLEDARSRLEHAGVAADYVWAPGEPARLIVDVAQERRAGAIVVGRHHHGMLGRLFGSDVAADVEREADCTVIVVD